MKRTIAIGLTGMAVLAGIAVTNVVPSNKAAVPPQIAGHGKVTQLPDAPEQPANGSKIVVDLTIGGPADEINKGLEKVARFVNIYSQAGKQPAQAKICVVLHANATSISLNDSAYRARFQTQGNPNLPLFEKLHQAGVEFVVCGQSLLSLGNRPDETLNQVPVAVSALTALVNRQQAGYAYVPLPD